jgi:hypothetical protein
MQPDIPDRGSRDWTPRIGYNRTGEIVQREHPVTSYTEVSAPPYAVRPRGARFSTTRRSNEITSIPP